MKTRNNLFVRSLSVLIVILTLLSLIPLNIFAATPTEYETVKDNVPIWSQASSKSLQQYRIEYEGTMVTVVDSKINTAGNLWYRLTDGNWVYSGNVRKHTHKAVMCGKAEYSYSSKNTDSHTVKITMPDLCSCGHQMGYETVTKTESHDFSASDSCTKCGYKAVHVHKSNWCGKTEYSYTPKNSDYHTVVSTYPDLCSCGYKIGDVTATKTEKHTFSNGSCTKCNYHVHKGDSYGKSEYGYTYKNEDTHTVKETKPYLCQCGYTVELVTLEINSPHHFNGNACTDCGYVKNEHTHVGTVKGETSYSYVCKNHETHYTVQKNKMLCECGVTVSIDTINLTLIEHPHSFVNGFCTDCGAKATDDNEFLKINVSQIVEQAVEGNYSDETTLTGIVGEVLVGFIPVVGQIADVRDMIYDIKNGADTTTLLLDLSAVLPLGDVLKHSDELVSAFRKLSVANDYGIDTYKNLKKLTKGKNLEVHHIIEKRFLNLCNPEKSNDFLSVALTHEEHKIFTAKWRELFEYGKDYTTLTQDKLFEMAQNVYMDYPELLDAARKTIYG